MSEQYIEILKVLLPYYKIAITDDGRDTVARAVALAMIKAFINNTDAPLATKIKVMDFDVAGSVAIHKAIYNWLEEFSKGNTQ